LAGQLVAGTLERAEVEQAGPSTEPACGCRPGDMRKPAGDDLGQLTLELADLSAHCAPGGPLVGLRRRDTVDGELHGHSS
jgi:hypothetical protein